MGTIYKIENTVNGKCYFGQTIKRVEIRKNEHFNALRKSKHYNDHLQKAFNKYGESAFVFTVISDSEADSQLDGLEKQLIEIFQTMNPEHGYNKVSGGNLNKKFSPESIEKNRQSRLRYFANGGEVPNKGKKMSAEAVENNRIAQLKHASSEGYIHPWQGMNHSLETKEKQSQARKGKLPSNSISVIGPDGFVCPSLTIASYIYKIERHAISKAIKNNKPYKGMSFSYLT
jgi:group I intron endonuclease